MFIFSISTWSWKRKAWQSNYIITGNATRWLFAWKNGYILLHHSKPKPLRLTLFCALRHLFVGYKERIIHPRKRERSLLLRWICTRWERDLQRNPRLLRWLWLWWWWHRLANAGRVFPWEGNVSLWVKIVATHHLKTQNFLFVCLCVF